MIKYIGMFYVTFILMHMIQTQEYKSRLGLVCLFLFMSIQQWTQYLSFKIDTGVSKQTLTNKLKCEYTDL